MGTQQSLSIVAFVCVLWVQAGATAATADENVLQGVVSGWEKAWGTHDANAMGTLFTEDADFVNVAGLHWHGKKQIVDEHAERLRTNLKDSVWLTRRVQTQLISPTLALVHIDWGMTGDTDFDGTPRAPRDGTMSWLLIKKEQGWFIRSAHNTNKTPRK